MERVGLMGKQWGKADFKQLKELEQRLEQLEKVDFDKLFRQLANEIAQILLNLVKKRTPVGVKPHIAAKDENDKKALGGVDAKKTIKIKGKSGKSKTFLTREGAILDRYWRGYTGGALRDAWTILPLEKQGDNYIITVVNNTEYASYVEYGHRQTPGRYVPQLGKSLKASWVKGRFMLTTSTQEIEQMTPRLLEQAIYQALKEVFR